MSILLKLALFTSLPFVALGARQRRATTDEFQIFAYGPGIGGPALFYADGYAYIGDPNLSNSSDAATVVFTLADKTLTGSPNTTTLSNSTSADWSNVTLFVPDATNSDHRIGFLDSGATSNSSIITSQFFLYGSTVAVIGSDGSLQTLVSGLQIGSTGIYQLYWNDTSLGQTPLTIRNIGPSNPSGTTPTTPLTSASAAA